MEYYSIPQIAERLKVSRVAIYKQVKNGSIQAVRIGRSYAILGDAIAKISIRGRKSKDPSKTLVSTRKREKKNIRMLDAEKQELSEASRSMSPEQRLIAYYNHNLNISKLYSAGLKQREKNKS